MTSTVHEFLGKDTIEALRRPVLDDARGLPASVYTSAAFFDLEQRELFPGTWMSIAFDSDVPAPGDAEPLEVCGLPLILTRDEAGEVRVLHNVCRHRATLVLQAPCKGVSTFKCPYHGWVYGLYGSLKATPFWDGTADARRIPVDAGCNGLVPVRSATWNHIVFVNLDGKADPLDRYLEPMATELSHLDIESLEPGHRVDWEFQANWKLVMENWEVYHHVWVHEGVFDRMSEEVDLASGEPYTDMLADGNALFLRYRVNPRRKASARAAMPPLPSIPRHRERTEPHGTANAILPNTTVSVSNTAFSPAIYVPVAPGRTRARMGWFFAPGAGSGPTYEASREALLDRWLGPTRRLEDRGGIRAQDHRCMELQQAARRSPVADDVKFSTVWESNVRYFQDWVITRLGA
ncbi:MAG: aromatic ring-hydroxylating oxygenase subunit alpha [Gammaproteobacteria bacterium]